MKCIHCPIAIRNENVENLNSHLARSFRLLTMATPSRPHPLVTMLAHCANLTLFPLRLPFFEWTLILIILEHLVPILPMKSLPFTLCALRELLEKATISNHDRGRISKNNLWEVPDGCHECDFYVFHG